MKPNGFVAAASMTSHTLTCRASQICLNSLANAMFTFRKVFSNSFDSSATRADDTRYTRSNTAV